MCGSDIACATLPEDCYSTGDEDNDGLSDCDDPDCVGEPICVPTTEIECQDGIDNDQDGFFDCLDGECRNPFGVTLQMDQRSTRRLDSTRCVLLSVNDESTNE